MIMIARNTLSLVTPVILLAVLLGCKFGSVSQEPGPALSPENISTATPATGSEGLVVNPSPTTTPIPAVAANAVCPDPAKPCKNKDIPFDEWAISFKLPAQVKPNKTYRSEQFYAIIVKVYETGPDEDPCDGGEYIESMETERKALQKEHPERKVFASYLCPNMGATEYEFPGSKKANGEALVDNFIAIYAGQTKEDAEKLLPALKMKYPKAAIKPMTSLAEWIYQ